MIRVVECFLLFAEVYADPTSASFDKLGFVFGPGSIFTPKVGMESAFEHLTTNYFSWFFVCLDKLLSNQKELLCHGDLQALANLVGASMEGFKQDWGLSFQRDTVVRGGWWVSISLWLLIITYNKSCSRPTSLASAFCADVDPTFRSSDCSNREITSESVHLYYWLLASITRANVAQLYHWCYSSDSRGLYSGRIFTMQAARRCYGRWSWCRQC